MMKANSSFEMVYILLILRIGITLVAQETDEEKLGGLQGKVNIGIPKIHVADVGPVVVYLDYVGKQLRDNIVTRHEVVNIDQVRQQFANFVPDFIAVTVGQTVEFPNNDTITHNVFSYSKPNEFDLGLYPKGTSKSVTFRNPGVVRIYCAIHKSMQGTIFVAPTQFHTLVTSSGSFDIHNIPVGRYRLRTWNNILPVTSQDINILPDQIGEISITIKGK